MDIKKEDDNLSLDSDSDDSFVAVGVKRENAFSKPKPTLKAEAGNLPHSDAHDPAQQGSSNGHFSGGITVKKEEEDDDDNDERLSCGNSDEEFGEKEKNEETLSHSKTTVKVETAGEPSDAHHPAQGSQTGQFVNDSDESDNESELPQEASRNTSIRGNNSMEITLSDDDDTNATGERPAPRETLENTSTSGYALRKKRRVNYAEMENENADEKDAARKKKKEIIMDIFAFSDSKIAKFVQRPELADKFTKCQFVFMDGTDSSKINLVEKFFEKCGHQFKSISAQIRYDKENFTFLKNVFKCCTALRKLHYRYQNRDDALLLLKLLKVLGSDKHLPNLHSLSLTSASGEDSLTEEHIAELAEVHINFKSIELGDYLWEDVRTTSLEKFLNRQKSSLENLIIHGGFQGIDNRDKKLITLPKMEKLTTLYICPSYKFLSEIKNPHSKKDRMITIGMNKREEPFKIAIKFSTDIPTLKRVVLGNLIEVEDLLFSSIRKLEEFRCGSYWNLTIKFPPDGSRRSLLESNVSELQFPDALKDPSFTVKVAKHFPNLRKVWMFLPSVPVLRAFFKAFENSYLEELYLKTQFDFESTMESCLLPRMYDARRKTNKNTKTILDALKEYKHFDEYVRYYNIELPVAAEDLMEGHSEGIRALKKLKVIHLEHIPRVLLIPVPDEERKWYDHNCKFMDTTFGFEEYPMNTRCYDELMKPPMLNFEFVNFEMEFENTGIRSLKPCYSDSSEEDEFMDMFTPVRGRVSSGAHVKIMPSMLLPDVKIKPEET